MRILNINLLAAALLLFGATSASAFSINMTTSSNLTTVVTSDTIVVNVFLDANPGLTLLGLAVLYPNDGTITYDGIASFNEPVNPGASAFASTGALSGYILYTASTMIGDPTTLLYPSVENAAQMYPGANFWNTWNGANQPGQFQVSIDYFEAGFNQAPASGTGIYIATLVFHIEAGFTGATLSLCVTCGGNTVNVGGSNQAGATTLGPDIVLVPEPTTAMLIGIGILGLAAAGRRRA